MANELLREVVTKLATMTTETHELIDNIRTRGYEPLPDLPPGEGVRAYRLVHNKYEAIAAKHWSEENKRWDLLPHLLGDGETRGAVTDRDRIVAATLMQWLGSSVGRCFLREMIAQFSAASPRKGAW